MARERLLTVRLSKEEHDLLLKVSAKLHLTMSRYIRKALIETARTILERPESLPQVWSATASQLVDNLTLKSTEVLPSSEGLPVKPENKHA